MASISLEQADVLIETCLEKSEKMKLAPLTIAVLDAGGHLVSLKRQDNSSILRPQIAQGKAWGALGMGVSTRTIADRFRANEHFFAAVAVMSEGKILASPGGLIIRNKNGEIIGAIGVSGDTGENDENCAKEGILALGLTYDP